jgi:hypothetical protein
MLPPSLAFAIAAARAALLDMNRGSPSPATPAASIPALPVRH